MAKPNGFLTKDYATPDKIKKVKKVNEIALNREQTLAQMAIAWLLKDDRVTIVLVSASKACQLAVSLKAIDNIYFEAYESKKNEGVLE